MKRRTKGIKPVSKKRAAVYKDEYLPLRKKFLEDNPVCQRCWKAPSVDMHHKQGRGEYLLATWTWAALCRICHTWTEEHPREATDEGLKVSRVARLVGQGN